MKQNPFSSALLSIGAIGLAASLFLVLIGTTAPLGAAAIMSGIANIAFTIGIMMVTGWLVLAGVEWAIKERTRAQRPSAK